MSNLEYKKINFNFVLASDLKLHGRKEKGDQITVMLSDLAVHINAFFSAMKLSLCIILSKLFQIVCRPS